MRATKKLRCCLQHEDLSGSQRGREETPLQHGSSLQRALTLVIAAAPPEAIAAAKSLQCSICQERRPPRARRPATLPTPKDAGDRVHIDLFELHDLAENRF